MDRSQVRKALGLIAVVLIVLGPYVAGTESATTSSTRRGRQAEEWFNGLQQMVGMERIEQTGAVVSAWVMVMLGVAAAAAWVILGRRVRVPAALVQPPEPWQRPEGADEPAPPSGYGNPFNTPPGQPGPDR